MKRLINKLQISLSGVYEEPELSATIRAICCNILGFGTASYFLKEPINLTEEDEERVDEIIRRLLKGEPLQYIEGSTPFCGMDFTVSPAVLIPRPETAELIDWIATDHPAKQMHILDLGTGSGCIAIALSRRLPQATIDACDISAEALSVAQKNNSANGTSVSFFSYDMLRSTAPLPHSYDILVSNPPYIKQCEATEMERNVTEWEPHTALFVPDDDALCFYRAIAELGETETLHAGGHIYVEINQQLGKETVELFESFGYKDVTLRKDIYGNDRMIRCRKN